MVSSYDVLIIGGGVVGATLALLLAENSTLSIGVIESQASSPRWSQSSYSHRVSAINLSSVQLFKQVNIWTTLLNHRISPFAEIEVWDKANGVMLDFKAQEVNEKWLGYIIENDLMQLSLRKRMSVFPNLKWHCPEKPTTLQSHSDSIEIITQLEHHFRAQLCIAADGGQSWVRQHAQIKLRQHDYQQKAIVATVSTEYPLNLKAQQVFLPTGPLAFLPLAEAQLASIVWSLPHAEADRLLTVDDETFKDELAHAFSHRLGKILTVAQRHAFSLVRQEASRYIQPRIALVGDAAHTVHPLAGQGVNMGLADAAALAELIQIALKKHRDFSSFNLLRHYERWRRAENLGLIHGIDWIKKIFATHDQGWEWMRTKGLQMTQRQSFIKKQLMKHALGKM